MSVGLPAVVAGWPVMPCYDWTRPESESVVLIWTYPLDTRQHAATRGLALPCVNIPAGGEALQENPVEM